MTIYLTAQSLARDNVIIARQTDDGLRFDCYDAHGPAWHHLSSTLKDAMRTVKEYRMQLRPDGPDTLTAWSKTLDWRLGIAQAIFTQAWNTCSYYKRYDLANWLDDFAHKYGVERVAQEVPVIIRCVLGVNLW